MGILNRKTFEIPEDPATEPPPVQARPEPEPRPKPVRQAMSSSMRADENAILGKGSRFEGKLTFEGTVRIGGDFKGEIKSKDTLVIGEGAVVEAEIEVAKLVLNGELHGNVKATRQVQLLPPAKLYGSIQTPSLIAGEGVIFEGDCKMENLDFIEKPAETKTEPKTEKPAKSVAKPAEPKEEPAKTASTEKAKSDKDAQDKPASKSS
jgi:cytoskeletal protein CcmA (bactofilin family)